MAATGWNGTLTSAGRGILLGVAALGLTPLPGRTQPNDLQRVFAGEVMIFSEPDFELLDANDDEALDDRETAACGTLRTVFEELDLDADDTPNRQEYMAFPPIWKQRVLAFGEVD